MQDKPYLIIIKNKMKETLKVFKIGGGIIDSSEELAEFLVQFHEVKGAKILVHGGGKGANSLLKELGLSPKMVEGRRVTDAATLNVVVQLYAGSINKKLVAQLQALATQAIGLSGADGNLMQAVKRPVKEIDYGFAGDLEKEGVNTDLLKTLLSEKYIPILCAITHDKKGQLLNTNADTIASKVALAMSDYYEVELHFCFDQLGVMKDLKDDASIVPKITAELYQKLKSDGLVVEGMIPKLDNAFLVLEGGVKTVIIEHALKINDPIKTVLSL